MSEREIEIRQEIADLMSAIPHCSTRAEANDIQADIIHLEIKLEELLQNDESDTRAEEDRAYRQQRWGR